MNIYSLLPIFLLIPLIVVLLFLFLQFYFWLNRGKVYDRKYIIKNRLRKGKKYVTPNREEQLARLNKEFDIIVVGGGATGTGIAVDASSRGYSVALFEAYDFSCGTSSRTTKLARNFQFTNFFSDGGVRYLQKAFKGDLSQFEFVYDSLRERKHFFQISPHLCKPLKIITPCFSWFSCLKNWFLLKVYDFLGGPKGSLGPSHFMSRNSTLKMMPRLKNRNLKGSVAYFDGQFNDARFNVLLATTACSFEKCVCLNHAEVVDLVKNKENIVEGVQVFDKIEGINRIVKGKVVINSCGYLSDLIRKYDVPSAPNIIKPSSGVHCVLDKKYAPEGAGILIPYTTDGRVLFILSYEGKCIVGTTEGPAELKPHLGPIEDNIQLVLKNMNLIYKDEIKRDEILSSWSGVRPLVKDPSVKSTAGLSRDHYISVSKSKLITICGGKWTTFRRMSRDCINRAIEVAKLPKRESKSALTVLVGSETIKNLDLLNKEFFERNEIFKDKETCEHLTHFYGDKAYKIAEIAKNENLEKKLHLKYPHVEAEVAYVVRYEIAAKISDVVANRFSMMYLDVTATYNMIRRISEIMKDELCWSDEHKEQEIRECVGYIKQCTSMEK